MIDDNPPDYFNSYSIIAVNNPVAGIDYFPGIGEVQSWVSFQYPVDRLANDLQVSFNSTAGFHIILKLYKNFGPPLKISLNFLNGLKNIIKPCINFRIHKQAFYLH